MYVCTHRRIHLYVCVYMYTRVYIYMYICIYIYMYIYICISICTHIHTHMHMCTCEIPYGCEAKILHECTKETVKFKEHWQQCPGCSNIYYDICKSTSSLPHTTTHHLSNICTQHWRAACKHSVTFAPIQNSKFCKL